MGEVRKLIYKDHDPYANFETMPFNGFTFERYPDMFVQIVSEVKPKLIVEVGSWLGGSAMLMAAVCKDEGLLDTEVVCIDTWLGSEEHLGEVSSFEYKNGRPQIYEQFLSNIIHRNFTDMITPFPIDSTNGLIFLRKKGIKANLVYIDGGHDYLSVKNDLYNAAHILAPGGWIVGDDFQHPDVRRAVYDAFGEMSVHDKGSKFIWVR